MSPVHPDLTALVGRRLAELGFDGRRMSYRQAAERARSKGCPISPETIRQIHVGSHSGHIADETVEALSAALDVSRGDILRAMHEQRSAPLPRWTPPAAAHRMTLRQRRAVESLIAVLTEADDRQTEDKSAGSDGQSGVVPNVTIERVGNGDDMPIKIAGAGDLPPLTDTANEYLVTVSDAIYERIKERLLNE